MNRLNNYRFVKAPTPLLKAKLDNIAIVPASMLPFKENWQQIANGLPQGSVFICHSPTNTVQRKILKGVEDLFKAKGHVVSNVAISDII